MLDSQIVNAGLREPIATKAKPRKVGRGLATYWRGLRWTSYDTVRFGVVSAFNFESDAMNSEKGLYADTVKRLEALLPDVPWALRLDACRVRGVGKAVPKTALELQFYDGTDWHDCPTFDVAIQLARVTAGEDTLEVVEA